MVRGSSRLRGGKEGRPKGSLRLRWGAALSQWGDSVCISKQGTDSVLIHVASGLPFTGEAGGALCHRPASPLSHSESEHLPGAHCSAPHQAEDV